jgi:hypothetical protein
MTITKTEFLTEYRARLVAGYPWAQDTAKLDRFMQSVANTINGAYTWNHDSAAATAIYRENGGKGKVTLKWLRALPAGEGFEA